MTMVMGLTLSPIINSVPSPTPNPKPTVAFTTPYHYATRLSSLLLHLNWTPLHSPTLIVDPTPSSLRPHIPHLLHHFSALAFTSRAGISAFLSALSSPPLPPTSSGDPFIIAALGRDAELLTPEFIARLCPDSGQDRVRLVVPDEPTPSGLAGALGHGRGRKVLCPVPLVLGLEEPPVVPDFLRDLGRMGWAPERVNAYVTRWAGPDCVSGLWGTDVVDGIIFTSTAEVEGMLKGLRELGLEWEDVRKRWPKIVVAAHGPVTAAGARRLGVEVDVVSARFSSFDGVVEALHHTFDFETQSLIDVHY